MDNQEQHFVASDMESLHERSAIESIRLNITKYRFIYFILIVTKFDA